MNTQPSGTRTHSRQRSGFIAAFVAAALVGGTFGLTQLVQAADESTTAPTPEVTDLPSAANAAVPASTVSVAAAVSPDVFPASTGGTSTVTVTISNPSESAATTVDSIDVIMPDALSYVAGSAKLADASTSDPTGSTPSAGTTALSFGQDSLVPAGSAGVQGTETLTFNVVKASGTSGVFPLSVTGTTAAGASNAADASVTVVPSPVALPVAQTVTQGESVSFAPNGTAGPGGTLDAAKLCLMDSVANACVPTLTTDAGVFTANPSGNTISFLAAPSYEGKANATYRVTDTFGQTADAVAEVTVTSPSAAPAVVVGAAPLYGSGAMGAQISMVAQGTPGSGQTIASTCVSDTAGALTCGPNVTTAANGLFTYVEATNTITYDPDLAFSGTDTAYYKITDSANNSATAKITVTVSDVAAAGDWAGAVGSNGTVSFAVDTVAVPAAGQTISSICVSNTADALVCGATATTSNNGTFDYSAGNITYTPNAAFSGTDTAYYQITDSASNTAIGAMTVTVVPAPTTTAIGTVTGKGQNATLTPAGSASGGFSIDPNLTCLLDAVDALTCGTTATVAGSGTFTYSAATGNITFVPENANVVGVTTVYYRVTDNIGTNSVVAADTSAVTVRNAAAPTAPALTGTTTNTSAVSLPVTASAAQGATMDASATCLVNTGDSTCSSLLTTSQGTWSFSAGSNAIIFTPYNTFTGSATATYRVQDNFGTQASNLASVTVTSGYTAPTITSITPATGTTAGGTAVTITGTGFLATPTVSFGSNAATNVVMVSGTSITATVPANTAVGAVNVVVTNPASGGGLAGTLTNGYTYTAASSSTMTVTAITPNSGATTGGTAVTITGTGFQNVTTTSPATVPTVTIGGVAATNVIFVSATSLTATTPAGIAGYASVVVTNPAAAGGATATLTNGYTYTAGTGTSTTSTTPITVTQTVTPGSTVQFPLCLTSASASASATPTVSATPSPASGGTITGPCIGNLLTDLNSVDVSTSSNVDTASWSAVSLVASDNSGTWNPRPAVQGIALSFTANKAVSSPSASPAASAVVLPSPSTTYGAGSAGPTSSTQAMDFGGAAEIVPTTTTTTAFVRLRNAGATAYTYYAVSIPVYSISTTPITPSNGPTISPSNGPTTSPIGPGATSGPGTGTGPTGTLPHTGGDIVLPSIIGLILLVVGGVVLGVWYRRRYKGIYS